MQAAIDAKPEVTHFVQSYHYERRTTRDSKGNTHTRTVRVNTHLARKEQKIKKWEDHSPPVDTLDFLRVLLLTRLWSHKEIDYTSKGWKKWKKTKKKIIKKNKHRDTHWQYYCTEEIPYHVEFMLVYNDQVGQKPWFANFTILVILDIILIGWIQRIKLNSNSKIVHFTFKKLIVA